jgi:oligo-1,6-glucosidase
MYLANHDQPRMLTRWGNDSPEFRDVSSKMLTTLIMTMRGTPYYYYGDEIGMSNIKFDRVEDYNDIELLTNYAQVKAKGGDLKRFLEGMKISSRDNGRTPMQWENTPNGGFTTGTPWLKTNPDYAVVNVAAQEKDPNSILNYFRKMVQLRKTEQTLVYGDWTLVDAENPDVFAYTRQLNGQKILVLLNFKSKPATVKTGLDLSKAQVLLGNQAVPSTSGELKPYESVVLKL